MTKPTSRLIWLPDSTDPLSVWACWRGAGDHYDLAWGDGTSQRMLWWQPPEKHTYLTAGAYGLVASRPAPGGVISVRAEAAVRTTLEPNVAFTLLGDGRTVRADLEKLPAPVRYRIDWGDGSSVTEHSEHDLGPEHTYPWGTGAPLITVWDLPAQRWARFTGPEIGPEPEPEPDPVAEWTFHHEYLPPGPHDNPESMTGEFRGRNLRPGATYRVRLNWSEKPDEYATARADAQGRAVARIPGEMSWTVQSGKFFGPWRTCVAYEDANPAGTYAYVPVTTRGDGLNPNGPTVAYALHPSNPYRFQVQVQKPVAGKYTVDWGDGAVQDYHCDDGVFAAWHTYPRGVSTATVMVTGPDGTAGSVRLGRANIVDPYFYRVDDILGSACRTRLEYPQGGAEATPMMVRWRDDGAGGERYGDGIPSQVHMFGPQGTSSPTRWYRPQWWGKEITVTVYGPLRDPLTVTMVVPSSLGKNQRRFDYEPEQWPDGSTNEFFTAPGSAFTAWFGDTREWDGGYSGKFHVTNHTDEPSAWQVEFELADPAVLREVWPSTAILTELPSRRWRIHSTTPLAPHGTAVVGARIEPPGVTKKYPGQVTARPWQPAPPGSENDDDGTEEG